MRHNPLIDQGELERLHEQCFSWALTCAGGRRAEAEDVLQMTYLAIVEGDAFRVERIRLDPTTYQAVVTIKIDEGYQFTTDTIASILTSGLLGDVYIGLDAGGETQMLADGGKLAKTQSGVVLEKLIGQFLFDKAAKGGDK